MNRLQKKCFVASTAFHLSLALILLVGPGFLAANKQAEDRPPINFVPRETIDELLSGGGSPNARPPQPQPPAPQPPAPQPQPRAQLIEPARPAPARPDLSESKPARKLPEVSLKPVSRSKSPPTNKPKPAANTDAQSSAADEKRMLLANAAKGAAQNIRNQTSEPTTVEMDFGPGGGGVTYANFLDALKKVYSDAWIVPDGVTDDEATAKARVTIARDGTVVDAHIIRPSGNSLADASVEMALRRVKTAVPLPKSAKEDQRTVTITFNVKAKRGSG